MSADLTPEVLAAWKTYANETHGGYMTGPSLVLLIEAYEELARIRSVRHGGVTTGELRALLAEATPGVWSIICNLGGSWKLGQIRNHSAWPLEDRADAKAAVALHNAAPALLDALDAQAAEIAKAKEREKQLREALTQAKDWIDEWGCDCGTDEPGTCAVCLADTALAEVADG